MEGGLQVISREVVKPSSPTPQHLKWLKLSSLDQLVSNIYIPLVFFYQANESTAAQISQRMKQSLSNTLTSFYPLAGRVDAVNLVVDCNDAGVEFVEARVRARLTGVIEDPDVEDLKKYAPIDPVGLDEMPLFKVQITIFDCGGIALGVNYLHTIADCHSAITFLNAWAALCRGEPEIPHSVSFDLANYFPARESPNLFYEKKLEKSCLKRFVFNREIVAHLKQNAITSSGSRVKDPTRVEVVSAFIWKQFLEAARIRNPKSAKTYAATHAVNLRGRSSLSHSLDNAFGNYFIATSAFADASNFQVEEFDELLSKLRRSIRKIDDDYITELQSNGNNYLDDLFKVLSLHTKEELELCMFSSWCRFPVYEMDYGFGTPLWYCPASLPELNITIFTCNKSGENIEAWISTEEDTLELLEAKINLISNVVKEMNSSTHVD